MGQKSFKPHVSGPAPVKILKRRNAFVRIVVICRYYQSVPRGEPHMLITARHDK